MNNYMHIARYMCLYVYIYALLCMLVFYIPMYVIPYQRKVLGGDNNYNTTIVVLHNMDLFMSYICHGNLR